MPPNDGRISLGDVNADGRVDLTDAHLIAAYLNDPSDPSLPPGIGQPVGAAGTAVSRIYWTDPVAGKIQRANLDGSGIQDLLTRLKLPFAIALDMAGGKIYWTDWGGDSAAGLIQRANLDGSNIQDLVTGLNRPFAIALDRAGGKIYWTGEDTRDTGLIQRANFDGSGIQDLVTGLSGLAGGILLDVAAGKIYWTHGKIQRANLDGSSIQDLVTGLRNPTGIALDVAGGKIYWADFVAGLIQRANLDGSGIQDLVTGLRNPTGIALDVAGGKIYWADPEAGKIQRANLDGSGAEDLVTTGLESPWGIALGGSVGPDLVVQSPPGVSDHTLTTGQSFTLRATVRNRGDARSPATTLRYYRSTNATIAAGDTRVGTDAVSALSASGTSLESISLRAPSRAGTYYYGACVQSVSGESDTDNNCSTGVRVTVASTQPDLVVQSPGVSDHTLTTGQSFTLRATVRNRGDARSPATTLRYYRSTNATIAAGDTRVGTDAVSALSASGTSLESISLRAPSRAGTYYYGACVQSVSGESDTDNNCSTGVRVTVASTQPDLVVQSPGVSDHTLTTGQSFTLRATVRNRGDARSPATTLRYYRSTNATIAAGDTRVGTDAVSALSASGTSLESISLRAPSRAGTYYYGACVQSVSGESDTNNNCSTGVRVTVASTQPDLVVQSPGVSDHTLTAGQSFTLRATVRNRGDARSPATTLRYYRSTNATIAAGDTRVGTDAVSALSASGTSLESISLRAPSRAGTYYYGACVQSVSGESDTNNNCSTGVRVTVSAGGDDHGNTRSTATSLSLGSSRSGRIDPGGDVDYFRVQVSGSGDLTVHTTGSTDTYGTLQDGSGSRLTRDDDGGSGRNFRIEHRVNPGTYYIQVRGYDSSTTGGYTLRAELEGDSSSRDNTRFNIDLVFVDSPLTADHRGIARQAADRWEEIVIGDLPDATEVSFDSRQEDWWGSIREETFGDIVVTNEFVDDLRIYVGVFAGDQEPLGRGGTFWLTGGGGKFWPTLATISVREDVLQDRLDTYQVLLHEMGHALGIGGGDWDDMIRLPSENDPEADTHFPGSRAVAAFNAAGGRDYKRNKVPVENGGDDGHWRESVMKTELMTPYFDPDERLSAVTVEALADLGYRVDATRADPYEVPSEAASKPAGVPRGRCEVLRAPARP